MGGCLERCLEKLLLIISWAGVWVVVLLFEVCLDVT